jgi:hypothetical protein
VSTVPGIDIVMGGHEHVRVTIPGPPTPIYKADSNVHSAWIHNIYVNLTLPRGAPNRVTIRSEIVAIDDTIDGDLVLTKVVQGYVDQAFAGFTAAGFSPAANLATPTEDLVGTNDAIFAGDTSLTRLFNLALHEEVAKYGSASYTVPPVDAALFNAGAIRIDDTIPKGTAMQQYDAIRISPYLNAVDLVNMTGALLLRTLQTSVSLTNSSNFLHSWPNVTAAPTTSSGWFINGMPLDVSSSRWYVVGLLHYLISPAKSPYNFLLNNPELVVLKADTTGNSDVRRSLIDQIRDAYSPAPTPKPGPGKDPQTILGLRTGLFALILVLSLVALGLIIFCCVRRFRVRSNAKKGGKSFDYHHTQDRKNFMADEENGFSEEYKAM